MKQRERWTLLLLGLAVVLSMGGSIRNGFVYDDVPIIVNNLRVTDPAHWHEILGSTWWLGSLWRPAAVAGFALQWQLGHGAPWIFHLVSLGLYLLLAWSTFRLLREIGGPPGVALVALLAFVVHPAHVEVVANVVGQAELMVATALVMMTWLYLRTRRLGATPARLLGILTAIAVATMSKEQGFVAPLLLLGAEALLLAERREGLQARLRLLVPTTSFTVLMLLLRGTVTGSLKGESAAVSLAPLDFSGRLVSFLGTVPEYARLLLWPLHLQADYSPPHIPVAGQLSLGPLLGVTIIGVLVALFLRWRRRAPLIAFGIWWAAVAMAPVSHLATAAGVVMAERLLFLPSLGFACSLTGALALLETEWRPVLQPMVQGLMAAWLLAATVRSALRVPVWHDQERFFSQLPVDAPDDYRAALTAGTFWRSINQNARAESELREAIRLWPHDANSNETLGQLLRASGRCQEAIPVMQEGLRIEPGRTSLRAKMVECLLATGDTNAAVTIADSGIALGDSSFVAVKRRILRIR